MKFKTLILGVRPEARASLLITALILLLTRQTMSALGHCGYFSF